MLAFLIVFAYFIIEVETEWILYLLSMLMLYYFYLNQKVFPVTSLDFAWLSFTTLNPPWSTCPIDTIDSAWLVLTLLDPLAVFHYFILSVCLAFVTVLHFMDLASNRYWFFHLLFFKGGGMFSIILETSGTVKKLVFCELNHPRRGALWRIIFKVNECAHTGWFCWEMAKKNIWNHPQTGMMYY